MSVLAPAPVSVPSAFGIGSIDGVGSKSGPGRGTNHEHDRRVADIAASFQPSAGLRSALFPGYMRQIVTYT